MGLTYHSRKAGVFDVNVSGDSGLGLIHRNLGLPISHASIKHDEHRQYPHVPYLASKIQAAAMAEWIKGFQEERIRLAITDEVRRCFAADMTVDDIMEWFNWWGDFLAACKGYHADPPWHGPAHPDYSQGEHKRPIDGWKP